MIVSIHDASTDKRTIAKLSWKPCPFCGGQEISVCQTPSYSAISCRELANCRFEFYRSGTIESANAAWNDRAETP